MNDTSPDAELRIRELWMARSPDERVRAACEMFDFARRVLIAGIHSEQPDITAEELRVKIFERTYGDEIEPALRASSRACARAARHRRSRFAIDRRTTRALPKKK
jgi:hypothetical protein